MHRGVAVFAWVVVAFAACRSPAPQDSASTSQTVVVPTASAPAPASDSASPSATASASAAPVEAATTCKSASDCTSPNRCCLGFASAEPDVGCKAASDCHFELCDTDATCPTGTKCADAEIMGKRRVCTSPQAAVKCGNTRCTADKPLCVFANGKGTCAASSGATGVGTYLLQCGAPGDCAGGQRCCLGGTYAACQAGCGEGSEARLCTSDADCVGSLGKKCSPVPSMGGATPPPWLKQCL